MKSFVAKWRWAALAVAASTITVGSAFSTTRILYLRDLAAFFWPYHLWLRETILAGQLPLWDPYLACGQSAVADPLRMVLFLPTLLPCVLLPPVLGFNVAAVLPFPIAALGAYLFARRHLSEPGACLAAIAFAASGPVLSTGNSPNLSWSVAPMPWALWAVDRLAERMSPRRVVVIAAFIAVQAVMSESVTLGGTCVLLSVYALAGAQMEGGVRARIDLAIRTFYGIVGGLMLAAAQLVPLLTASANSVRAGGLSVRLLHVWSLHPATLVETIAPWFYGDTVRYSVYASPWIPTLNDGLEPFLFSIYVGVASVALAAFAFAALPRRRWVVFWAVVLAVALVCALGRYTPIYPAMQEVLLPLKSFRFPEKYLLFAALALAALVGAGWDALSAAPPEGRRRGSAAALALAGAIAVAAMSALAIVVAPEASHRLFSDLATAAETYDVKTSADFLAETVPESALRLVVLSAAAGGLVWLGASGAERARFARWLVFGLIAVDLVVTNAHTNPTIDATLLVEPPWVAHTRAHPNDRVYIGKRPSQAVAGPPDVDQPAGYGGRLLAELDEQELLASESVLYAIQPSAWRLREGISHDLDLLFPREYIRTLIRFRLASRERRAAFLDHVGARYHLVAVPPVREARPIVRGFVAHRFARPANPRVTLYEVPTAAPRVSVVTSARVVPDVTMQIELLFDAAFDSSAETLVNRDAPEPAGAPGIPVPASATVTQDGTTEVVVAAGVPEGGGYLVLLDSFDPYWRVEVDGVEAPLLRANGLFRAVRLAPGAHSVRFVYTPIPFYDGLAISALAALVAAVLFWKGPRRDLA